MGSEFSGEMLDPSQTCLFVPDNLKAFKLKLFLRIGEHIKSRGGQMIRGDLKALEALPDEIIPIVGCMPECTALINKWKARGRKRIQWDRGYFLRVFASDLPWGKDGGYYRWHVDSFQAREIRDVPGDRWKAANIPLWPWSKNGKHIVLADASPTYEKFHGVDGWSERAIEAIRKVSDRPIVRRIKEMQRSGRKLHEDLKGAHCLVTHGSIAAVESVIMGCPVFVHPESAAALVGKTDLSDIENPIHPDREPWVHSLAYDQFNERELVDGTLWKLLS